MATASTTTSRARRCSLPVAIGALASAAVLATSQSSVGASTSYAGTNGRIALVSDRGEQAGREIWAVALDGTARQLTHGDHVDSPVWSPDGQRIAFNSYGEGETVNIALVDASGSKRRLLVRDAGDPSWAPDGTRLLFTNESGGFSTVNMDGTGLREIVGTGGGVDPKWSPDGGRIAFVRAAGGVAVYVAASDGRGARRLRRGERPAWAPDGRRLAYLAPDGHTHVVDADGSGDSRAAVDFLEWSPNGRRVVFVEQGDDNAEHLFVANLDGTGRAEVRVGGTENEQPSWQPRCTIYGTRRDDRLAGTPGRDVMCGLGGNDVMRARGGNDVLLGGAGNDCLDAGAGKDWMFGGMGNDTLASRDGASDVVDGGVGRDRASIDDRRDTRRDLELSATRAC